jgi:hypothetical protein
LVFLKNRCPRTLKVTRAYHRQIKMQPPTQSTSYSPNATRSFGARERLRHVLDTSRSPLERQNTMKLLANNQQLPRHLRERFFQNPEYPANKLVERLRKLADVNPDVKKKAKVLLDQLENFFDGEKESAPEEGPEPGGRTQKPRARGGGGGRCAGERA